ncbi:MAG: response regulator transcription factor [Pyrinomonadaceae bacterium]
MDKITDLAPADVAVVYISTGDRVEIISDLLRQKAGLPVVLIIASVDLDSQAEALKLGAVGIVHKEQNPKLLIEAIRQTYNGETWLNQVLLNKILEKSKSSDKTSAKGHFHMNTDSLTARELEVVKMIGEGLKNKIIAERLSISEATVRHHLSSIYGKVGVEDRLNLVIFAYQKGIITLTDQPGVIPTPLTDE